MFKIEKMILHSYIICILQIDLMMLKMINYFLLLK